LGIDHQNCGFQVIEALKPETKWRFSHFTCDLTQQNGSKWVLDLTKCLFDMPDWGLDLPKWEVDLAK
jgi:hypothetical protein